MTHLLFDTNILVYLLDRNPRYVEFVEQYSTTVLRVSVVSFMEIFMGIEDGYEQEKTLQDLNIFEVIPLTQEIGIKVTQTLRERKLRNLKTAFFGDVVIAHTALFHHIPLVTNNPKDFRDFPGLEIIVP